MYRPQTECETLLRFCNEVRAEYIKEGKYKGKIKKKCDAKIAEKKKECRAAMKEKERKSRYMFPGYGEIVNSGGDWDSCWMKVFFKGEHWTEEEIEEFLEDNWRYVRYPAYDCTGDLFTLGIEVFNVPGGVVAYLREAVDV